MVRLPLKESISSKGKKQVYVNQMFATIAPRYDLVTRLFSFGADQRWKKMLVDLAQVEPQHCVLDLACGTGDITFLLAQRTTSGRVYGVDITPGMLEIAEEKKQRLGLMTIRFELRDVMELDFPEASFDRITTGYGLRNLPDIPGALGLILRLLKPGGRFVSLDFGKPASPLYRAVYLWYLQVVGSLLGWVIHGDADVYRYIPESLKLYPAQHGIKELMDAAEFVETGYLDLLGGTLAINFGRKSLLGN
jgi:demethylmenaquinone methyltransferase / 2-methoxy-6-polyprenyl-1,4-benzoquinol methylase